MPVRRDGVETPQIPSSPLPPDIPTSTQHTVLQYYLQSVAYIRILLPQLAMLTHVMCNEMLEHSAPVSAISVEQLLSARKGANRSCQELQLRVQARKARPRSFEVMSVFFCWFRSFPFLLS